MVCADDKFSKPFKTDLGKDVVYDSINSMIKENKFFIEVMKKHFNKELVMTKGDNENFKNSTKCLICDNDYIDNNVKVRDHCPITEKYRDPVHRDCNLKLNHKIAVVLGNLKHHDSHLIMQELGIFNLKINVIPNGLEKCMNFTMNKKLTLIILGFLKVDFPSYFKKH